MKIVLTLSKYISRQFFLSFLMVLGVFSVLVMLMDSVELLRRASSKQIPMLIMFDMMLLKLPMLIQAIMPFIVLVSAVLAYTSLARRSELVVIRAAGVSVWEFLIPSIITAFLIGIVVVVVVNPLSAIMLNKYEHLNAHYFENKQNLPDISDTGLWIRQQYDVLPEQVKNDELKNDMVIHATEVKGSDDISLDSVEVIAFDPNDVFLFRIDAPKAILKNNQWIVSSAMITFSDHKILQNQTIYLPTTLRQSDIQNSFADPQAISFFELPRFIHKLENSGFSALGHILQWHKIISSPFFYSAMVMIGAIFSLKAPRQGAIGYSISYSVVFGFVIYFLSNLVSSIGLSGSMPVMVSAWTPIIITMLMGAGLLLHLEDG